MSKVQSIKGGITKNGKGSFPRFNYQTDDIYKENFDKIFGKRNEGPDRKN